MELAELLIGQRDQRRGVVETLPGVEGLEDGRLGDERLAHPRRDGDQQAALRLEPGQQGLLLERVQFVRDAVQKPGTNLSAVH